MNAPCSKSKIALESTATVVNRMVAVPLGTLQRRTSSSSGTSSTAVVTSIPAMPRDQNSTCCWWVTNPAARAMVDAAVNGDK